MIKYNSDALKIEHYKAKVVGQLHPKIKYHLCMFPNSLIQYGLELAFHYYQKSNLLQIGNPSTLCMNASRYVTAT